MIVLKYQILYFITKAKQIFSDKMLAQRTYIGNSILFGMVY